MAWQLQFSKQSLFHAFNKCLIPHMTLREGGKAKVSLELIEHEFVLDSLVLDKAMQEEIVGGRQKEGTPPCVGQGQNSHCISCSLVAPAEECPIPTPVFQQPIQIHNSATIVLRHSQQSPQETALTAQEHSGHRSDHV